MMVQECSVGPSSLDEFGSRRALELRDAIDADVFPLPGSVGALYEIGANQWTAINDQAGVVVEAQQIAQWVVQVIPNYRSLLPACVKWRSETYQSLLAQAVLVGMFAAGVPGGLSKIQQDIASMADADPLSRSQQFVWRVQFKAFANHAGAVEKSVAALAPDIADFVAENQTADVALEKIASSLPPEWRSIAGPLADLTSGFAAMQGGWTAISSQLQALASGESRFVTAGQARAAVAAAIPAWTALNQSAIAFDQHATNPTG
jgi:hypothetical protein